MNSLQKYLTNMADRLKDGAKQCTPGGTPKFAQEHLEEAAGNLGEAADYAGAGDKITQSQSGVIIAACDAIVAALAD